MAVGPDPGDRHDRRARVTHGALLPPVPVPCPCPPALAPGPGPEQRPPRLLGGQGVRPPVIRARHAGITIGRRGAAHRDGNSLVGRFPHAGVGPRTGRRAPPAPPPRPTAPPPHRSDQPVHRTSSVGRKRRCGPVKPSSTTPRRQGRERHASHDRLRQEPVVRRRLQPKRSGGSCSAGRSSGEPLVFYRTEDEGTPVALHDRCVHRRYPLSESGLDGDRIVCGYHGFTYDTTGACVYVPGQKRVPRTARVASYPVVEQDSLIWVWIGDPALADPQTIPRAQHLAAPGWVTVRGMEPIDADYGLLVDNLLDLSHETYLHGGYIGTPEVAETPITTEVDEGAGVVRVQPAHGRRRVPAVLREVDRHRGPDHALAGHRVLRPVPVSAAQPDRPRGRAPRGGRQRPERLPHRDHVRDHPVDGRQGVRLLDGLPGLGDRRATRSPSSCGATTTRSSCRTSSR